MKYYPLLQSQIGVFFDTLKYPNVMQYNLPSYACLGKGVDPDKLEQTVMAIYNQRRELHLSFMIDEEGNPRQYVNPDIRFKVERKQMTEQECLDYIHNGFVRPFDIFGGESLFRSEIIETENGNYLLFDMYHLVADGMSYTPIFTTQDFPKAYAGEDLGDMSYGMLEAALDEQASFGTEQYAKAKQAYAEKFAGMDFASFSTEASNPVGTMRRERAFIPIADVDTWCKDNGIAVNLLFQAAFSYAVSVLLGEDKVAYTTVNHGRMDKRLRNAYGMYVRSVPILSNIEPGMSVRDYIMSFRRELMSTVRNAVYPFSHLCSDLGMTPGVSFNFQAIEGWDETLHVGDETFPGFQPDRGDVINDLTAFIFLYKDQYEIRMESSEARNNRKTMRMLADAIKHALIDMMSKLDAPVKSVSILSAEEYKKTMEMSAGKHLDVDITKTFAEAFVERAKLCPDAPAVVDAWSQFTYAELDRNSNILAHMLIDNGVEPNSFVCVMLDRKKEFPLSVLAIHKSGAAYTPLDFEYPNERLSYMIENSQSKVLVTTHDVLAAKTSEGNLEVGDSHIIYIDDIDFNEANLCVEPINLTTPDNLAYMIYTSGSTGKPKGAMLHQAGLWNFINVVIDMEKLTAEDRIEGHRSFSFDAHIEDMYAILTLGGSFHIMPTEIRKDLQAMHDFILEHKITGGGYSTAIAALLLNTFDDLPIRFITAGGEKLAGVYSDHIEIINVYGPTECTDDTSYYSIKPGERVENIPIGKSVANSWNFIISKTGQLVPPGVAGELCFAGVQVGRGYWQLPERTAQAFCDCPFVEHDAWGRKVRMYHTGDLCRWNEDGDLEFIGRIDFQVKLRGFRIELGEIENKVLSIEGVRQAAAEVKKVNNIDHLLLYYTLEEGCSLSEADIRKSLEESSLADYMVPDTYVEMETMPLTPNGKVNRRALPMPEIKSLIEYVEPANETERVIAETIKKVLGLDTEVGALNNFFEYGGDSIKAIRLVSMLRQKNIILQVSTVMKEKTVRGIAAAICSEPSVQIDQEAWSGTIQNSAIQQFFFDLEMPEPHHYNQAVMLATSKGKFEKEALEKSLDALTAHHDMLRCVVRNNSLYIRDVNEGVMYTILEADATDNKTIETIANEVQASINLQDGPLMKLAIIHQGDKDNLLVAMHHTITDGVSWRIFVEDLANAYNQALTGKDISLPAKTHSYKYYTEAMLRYKQSHLLAAEKDYWDKIDEEVGKTKTSTGNDYGRKFTTETAIVDAATTKNLLNVPSRCGSIEINDLLITALGRSYASLSHEESISILLEGHGRETIGEPLFIDRTIGWFTSMYPVVLKKLGKELVEDVINVKDTLHRVPNHGFGYGQLKGFAVKNMPKIMFNYLGTFESGNTDAVISIDETVPTGNMVSPKNCYGSDITINCMILPSGQFSISMTYNEASLTHDDASALLLGLKDEITAISNMQLDSETAIIAPDLGETVWTRVEFTAIQREFAQRNETIKRIYPLTPMQEGMLLKAMMDPESVAYRIVFAVEMTALPSESHLRAALDKLAVKHEVLRTSVIYRGVSASRQAVVAGRHLGLTMMDITGEADKDAAIARIRMDLLHNAFDLQSKPLFNIVCLKTSENTCTLLLVFHHIIEDGWCLPIIQNDFFSILDAEMSGTPLTVESVGEGRYENYARGLKLREKEKSLTYWRNLLDGYETKAVIPSWGEIAEAERTSKDSILVELSSTEQQQLDNLCKGSQITPNTVVELAWGLLLSKFNRTNDAVFAKVVSGRDNSSEDVSDIIGIFINTVPVRVHLEEKDTVIDALKAIQAQAAETNMHDYLSLSDVQQESELGSELYQSTVVFENYPAEKPAVSPWKFDINPVITKEENFDDINLVCYVGDGGRLSLCLEFNNTKYSEKQATDVLNILHTLVVGIIDGSDAKIMSLPMLDEATELEVTKLSEGKHVGYDLGKTFVDLFTQASKRNPDAPAVVDEMGKYSYGELNRLSSALALKLRELGVGSADVKSPFVSIMLGYQKEFLVAAIGVEKAGGAYVPLDYDYPNDRLLYMLEDSESQVLITSHIIYNEKTAEGDNFTAKNILFIEDFITEVADGDYADVNYATPDSLAYMIYTSGSTGKPKGVMIPHRAKSNFVQFIAREWGHTSESRISCHSSFSFDASIEDLYPVLTVGGTLYTVPQEARKDMGLLHDFIIKNGITGGCYTTQLGQMLLQMYPDLPVDYLVVGGEKMTTAPQCKCRLINTYGPTEFTVDATFFDVVPGKEYKNIPIGRALDNLCAYVVDQCGQLVPQGVAGELCLAGPQMAEGYWKREDLTAEKFSSIIVDGEMVKVYHTGDLVRYNTEGQIEYMGRIDSQVKLRGFRIELGEIETLIASYQGVQMVCVQVKEVGGVQHLCAYYTADTEIDVEALKTYLAGQLTDYMVPTAYMQLAEMPLTPNGKVNTKALPDPQMEAEEIVAPETDTEKQLWNMVTEALRSKQLGVTNNLSLFGMTSIVAMRLAMTIQKEFDVQIPVAELIKEPMIRAIAAKIDEKKAKEAAAMNMFTKRKTDTASGEKKADPFAAKKADPFAVNKKKNPFE